MSEIVYQSESADRALLDRLPHAPARYAAGVLALGGLYYAGAKTGYLLEFSGPVAAIVWLPVGVGISFLYLGGIAYWPGLLIGDLLANQYSVLPLGSALGQTCGNVLEVLIATLLLRRLVRHGSPLASVRGVGAIAVSVAAGAAVSATVGATSLLSGGVVAFHEVPTVWRTWWLGDATGALLVVPLALAWYRPLPRALAARPLARGHGAPGRDPRPGRPRLPELEPGDVPGLPGPDLGRAPLRAARCDARASPITAVFTVWNTTHYIGPFHFALGHAERAQHPALHRRRRALHARPGRGGHRARALRRAARRLPLAADLGLRQRPAPARARSPRRRPAAADLARAAAARCRGRREARAGARGPRCWKRPRTSSSSRSTSCASSRTGSIPRCWSTSAWPRRSRASPCARASRSSCSSSPPGGSTPSVETIGYYVVAEAIANAQKHSGASLIEVRASAGHDALRLEIADDGVGGAAERPGSGPRGPARPCRGQRRHDGALQPARRRDAHPGRHSGAGCLSRLSSLRGDVAAGPAAFCWSGRDKGGQAALPARQAGGGARRDRLRAGADRRHGDLDQQPGDADRPLRADGQAARVRSRTSRRRSRPT